MAILVWTSLAVVFGFVAIYEWLSSGWRNSSDKCAPSPWKVPLLGHPFHLTVSNCFTGKRWSDGFGSRSYILKLITNDILFLTTLAETKEAIVDHADVFSKKSLPTKDGKLDRENNTILFLDGPIWREKRRFTLHHLRNLGFGKRPMENTIIEEFGRVVDILDETSTMTFDNFFFIPFLNVLWGIVANKTYEHGDVELRRVNEAIRFTLRNGKKSVVIAIFAFVKYIPGDPIGCRAIERNIAAVKAFISKEIDEHSKTLDDDGEPRDYIDAYLMEIKKKQGHELTEENACYERCHLIGAIYDILQAGVETTATTLEWSLLYMATWPEIQEKVHRELDAVIGRNRTTVYADSPMLPYVKAVLMEVQRYCSVVPLSSPRIVTRTTKLKNYTIREGSLAIVNIYAVHNEKRTWGDPEIFRPERFLGEDGRSDKMDGWMPFSLGPRICLGESLARMELFLYFTGLMQRYSFRVTPGHRPPTLAPVVGLTLQPRPFQLTILKR